MLFPAFVHIKNLGVGKMIKELLEGLKARLKGVGESPANLPPAGGVPPSPFDASDSMPPAGGELPKDGEETLDSLVNAAPTGGEGFEDFSTLLGGGTSGEIDNKVKELEEKHTDLENQIRKTIELTEANSKRLDSIDTNMKKFLSLYELVTNQINPFVDSPYMNPKKMKMPEPEPEPVMVAEVEEESPVEEVEDELPVMEEPEPEPSSETPVDTPKVEVKKETPKLEPSDSEKVMFFQSVKDGNASFVVEWITSLVAEDGDLEKNAKLLKYLLDLGWITPKAHEALMTHLYTLANAPKTAQKQKIPVAVGGMVAPPEQSISKISMGEIPATPKINLNQQPLANQENLESVAEVLEWIKYLVDTVGLDNAEDIMQYLVKLGWITPSAHSELIKYIEKTLPKKFKEPSGPVNGDSKMVLTPGQIPSPQQFIDAEKLQYQIPISEPQTEEPQNFVPKPIFTSTAPSAAIIPLREIGSDIDSLAIVLEWIRYLVDRAGTSGTKDIFRYYNNIGWVEQNVLNQLEKYVDGIRSGEKEPLSYNPSVEDHATSLFFISKLKHMEVSETEIQSMLGNYSK